jgi:hypothetical protein
LNALAAMDAPLARFAALSGVDGILDRVTGLLWESAPSGRLVTWAEAQRCALVEGWRMPTIGEIASLLAGLVDGHPFLFSAPGLVFWSVSESPFAPATHARVATCEASARFTVHLLDKDGHACLWGVRGPLGPSRLTTGGTRA